MTGALFPPSVLAITDPGDRAGEHGDGAEFFPTAEREIVAALLRGMAEAGHEPLPLHGRVREAAAGEGALVEHLEALAPSRTRVWDLHELRRKAVTGLVARCERLAIRTGPIHVGDFLAAVDAGVVEHVPTSITNPPWSRAIEWAAAELRCADHVALHVPLATIETPARARWLRDHIPDVYPLEWRPDYDGRGGMGRPVCWLVWGPGRGGRWWPLTRA